MMAERFIIRILVTDVHQWHNSTEQKAPTSKPKFVFIVSAYARDIYNQLRVSVHVCACESSTGIKTKRFTEILEVIYADRDECQSYQTG